MKIFEQDDKINFVDENNIFVGFDLYKSCCEDFGWEISDPSGVIIVPDTDFTGYVFDKFYFEEKTPESEYDVGGAVTFRLTKNEEEIFLTLWNYHNGYYAHGFDFTDSEGKIIKEWTL